LFYICFSFGFGFKGKYRILICSALIVLYLFSRNSLLPPIVYEVFPYHGQHYDHLTPCFVYGMIIFYLYERSEKNVSLLSASIFLLLGVCGVKVFSLVNQGLPCALIIWSMISLEPWIRKNLKYFSWANALGDWSYSTYLNHLFFMYLSKWLYDENILRNLHLNFIFYILCIITFSYLSFLFLEKPAGLFLKRVLENGYFYTRRSLHELAKPLLNFSRQLFPLKTN